MGFARVGELDDLSPARYSRAVSLYIGYYDPLPVDVALEMNCPPLCTVVPAQGISNFCSSNNDADWKNGDNSSVHYRLGIGNYYSLQVSGDS